MPVKVGDEVLYHPYSGDNINNPTGEQYFAAHVAAKWNDNLVNLQVVDGNGDSQSRTSVTYWDGEGDDFLRYNLFSGYCAMRVAIEAGEARIRDGFRSG